MRVKIDLCHDLVDFQLLLLVSYFGLFVVLPECLLIIRLSQLSIMRQVVIKCKSIKASLFYRISLLDKMCKSIKKQSMKKWQEALSVKPLLYRLENFQQLTSSLRVEYFKSHSTPRLAHCLKDKKMLVTGVIFIRHIKGRSPFLTNFLKHIKQ